MRKQTHFASDVAFLGPLLANAETVPQRQFFDPVKFCAYRYDVLQKELLRHESLRGRVERFLAHPDDKWQPLLDEMLAVATLLGPLSILTNQSNWKDDPLTLAQMKIYKKDIEYIMGKFDEVMQAIA